MLIVSVFVTSNAAEAGIFSGSSGLESIQLPTMPEPGIFKQIQGIKCVLIIIICVRTCICSSHFLLSVILRDLWSGVTTSLVIHVSWCFSSSVSYVHLLSILLAILLTQDPAKIALASIVDINLLCCHKASSLEKSFTCAIFCLASEWHQLEQKARRRCMKALMQNSSRPRTFKSCFRNQRIMPQCKFNLSSFNMTFFLKCT